MRMVGLCVLAVTLLAYCSLPSTLAQTCQDERAVAYFNDNGFRGRVIISKDAGELSFNASGLQLATGQFSLAIHELSAFVGTSESSCQGIGAVYNPTSAQAGMELGGLSTLPALANQVLSVTTGLNMINPYGIIGRTLVIQSTSDGTATSCATIQHVYATSGSVCPEPDQHNYEVTHVAAFNGDISGRVFLRQASRATTQGTFLTTVYSHLYSTQGRAASTGHQWAIRSGLCTSLGSFVANLSVTADGQVPISAGPSGYAGRHVTSLCLDSQLPTGTTERSLAVYNADSSLLACARVHRVPHRSIRATFTGDTSGYVAISQGSPFTASSLRINLMSNTVSSVGSTINTLPVQSGQGSSAGQVFNPFMSQTNVVGRIGDKLGNATQGQVCDRYSTLRGLNSLAGRSATITYNSQQSSMNLEEQLASGDRVLRARADFSGAVTGTIYLAQVAREDGSRGETLITSSGLTNAAQSMQHNMHVHVNRIGWQNDASACGGQFTAGHYDPHGVARNSTLYSAECGQMYPHRCEVGDTSRKTGQFNLDGSGFVRHDVNLPLDGNYRVIGRSFVIHAPNGGGPRVACANIVPMTARTFQLRFNVSALNGGNIDLADIRNRLQQILNDNGPIQASIQQNYVDAYNTTELGYIRGVVDGAQANRAIDLLAQCQMLGPYTRPDCPSSTSAATLPTAAASLVALLIATTTLLGLIF
ncbi:uncharacterized protein LOC135815860 [Sycon ciliatum]|uniref:uncharacterized protein LOC135815860 n=1 Tax=Sycon ciliatum TaxID=27933 RepID=UPI0031F61C83